MLEIKDLDCPKEFSCPDEIKARVNFWISVYAKHGARTGVLHDARVPERVYSILQDVDEPCRANRRNRDTPTHRERTRVEDLLRDVSARLAAGNAEWNDEEKHVLALFPGQNPQEILEAADSVRCQAGNRDAFLEGLRRFTLYKEMVAEKVGKYKLSPDILYLPFVESSYNPKAYSRVGAAGLWQIMPRTARTLGLTLNSNVDERFDPEYATEGAMKYLRDSYETLEGVVQSMGLPEPRNHLGPFVITSYNYGIVGAKDILRETGIRFSDALVGYKGKRFKTAVQNFYASFMAARHVATHAPAYFGKIPPLEAARAHPMAMQRALPMRTILQSLGTTEDELRPLNPALTPRVWKGVGIVPKDFVLKLPTLDADREAKLARLWTETVIAPATAPAQPEETSAVDESHHKVRAGESPCAIARRYKLACADLMAWNRLTAESKVVPGQLLALRAVAVAAAPTPEAEFIGPPPPPAKTGQALTAMSPEQVADSFGLGEDYLAKPSQVGKKDVWVITVQSEETLGHLSEWAGSSPSAVRGANNLGRNSTIRLGQTLIMPFADEARRKAFEESRIQYHKTLEDEFKERYDVVGEEIYSIRRGDSEQSIADRFEIPLWILRRFNPSQTTGNIRAGDRLRIPQLRAKTPAQEIIAPPAGPTT